MRIPDLIKKKRDAQRLSEEEIRYIVNGCTTGDIPEYQLSALLMAIYFSGMDNDETVALTLAMRDSGDKADLSGIDGVKVDKHSTGGVGDKTTLIVAPIVAACGVKVAKMSGRGLGHTGGTVDKLESIPGFKTDLPPARMKSIVNSCGLSITGQSGNLCPADKKLYALRDVTATVDSIPLIASSIMSKKLADSADCILLDVKAGSGSFMKTLEQARLLARTMVDIGNEAGTKTAAVISNMDVPLGQMVGNSLEVQESVAVLSGETDNDLFVLCRELAASMLMMADQGGYDECVLRVERAVESGRALECLRAMVTAQGGDVSYIDNPSKFAGTRFSKTICSERNAYISKMDSERIGLCAVALGAGRERKDDGVDHAAGICILKKTGDFVECGEPIAQLFTNRENALEAVSSSYISSLYFNDCAPEATPLILDKIE